MQGARIDAKRGLLVAAAALLAAAGLWLSALAGADNGPTVRQGVYGPECKGGTQTIDTEVTKGPGRSTSKDSASFEFDAFYCVAGRGLEIVDDSLVEFECRLDKAKAKGCKSPQKYRHLKTGKHKFYVAASFKNGGSGGDPTPATYKWKIVR